MRYALDPDVLIGALDRNDARHAHARELLTRSRRPISAPDAHLLATARHTGCPAVSFDRTIGRAATADGIPAGSTADR